MQKSVPSSPHVSSTPGFKCSHIPTRSNLWSSSPCWLTPGTFYYPFWNNNGSRWEACSIVIYYRANIAHAASSRETLGDLPTAQVSKSSPPSFRSATNNAHGVHNHALRKLPQPQIKVSETWSKHRNWDLLQKSEKSLLPQPPPKKRFGQGLRPRAALVWRRFTITPRRPTTSYFGAGPCISALINTDPIMVPMPVPESGRGGLGIRANGWRGKVQQNARGGGSVVTWS